MPKLVPVLDYDDEVVLMTEEQLHQTELSWNSILNQLGKERWNSNPRSRFSIEEKYKRKVDYEKPNK